MSSHKKNGTPSINSKLFKYRDIIKLMTPFPGFKNYVNKTGILNNFIIYLTKIKTHTP